MNNKVLFLMILAAISTGCMDSSGGTGITVDEMSVQPSDIRAGSIVSVNFEATNQGKLDGTVDLGNRNGAEVLTNYCSDLFEIKRFTASSSRDGDTKEKYEIGTGEKIRMNWRLNQFNEDEIPLQGYDCNMRFELPFNYSVRAYKQLQVKKGREVEGSSKLANDISEGPLSIDMKIIGSTSDQSNTILKQDNASLYLTAHNTESEESSYAGLIEIDNIEISDGGSIKLKESCGNKESISLASGDQKIYRCNIGYEEFSSPSVRGEIEANINYTFVKDLGSRKVKVKYNGR